MKKAPIKILLAAAIIAALSFSAFAAFGGLDYMRGIFGDSIDSIQDQVVTPLVKASADGREMAVEALVTDGYVTNLIVSLTGSEPSDEQLFHIAGDSALRSVGWVKLDEFSVADKTCYAIDMVSQQRFDKAKVRLALNKNVADIALAFELENNLGNAVVKFPAGAKAGRTRLLELQISPMGFLLTGSEDDPQGGLPAASVKVVFANKKTETMEVQFAESEDSTVSGGGGAVIVERGQKAPLVTKFHGVRNPDGELVVTGQFSRVIHPAEIVKVVIDGVAYPVN